MANERLTPDQLAEAISVAEQCQSTFRAFERLGILVKAALSAETVIRERETARDAVNQEIEQLKPVLASLRQKAEDARAVVAELDEEIATRTQALEAVKATLPQIEESGRAKLASIEQEALGRRAMVQTDYERRVAELDAQVKQRAATLEREITDLEKRRDALVDEVKGLVQRFASMRI